MADRSDFQRQRRNLIIISLVLSFVELSGIEVKVINLFGNELDIVNPEWVNWALWIGLFYWGFRYYTYFLKEKTGFGAEFWGRMDKRIVKQAVYNSIKDPAFKDMIPEDKIAAMKEMPLDIQKISYRKIGKYIVQVHAKRHEGVNAVFLKKTVVSGNINYWIAVKSIIDLFFNTPIFTEYILPFVLFAIPIVIWLYNAILK